MPKPQPKGEETKNVSSASAPPSRWLIVELEEAVDQQRAELCREMASRLKDTDVSKIEEILIRYGLCAAPMQAARAIASALGLRAAVQESLLKAMQKWLEERYLDEHTALRPAYAAAIEACRESGRGVAFLSSAPETAAQGLFRRFAPETMVGRLHVLPLGEGLFPSIEQWQMAAQATGAMTSNCTALVAVRSSFKSALAADLRCVAVPDRFTQAQDFSGADAVFESDTTPSKRDFLEVL
jgi:beta-phosphoglucomutase-like phosphatase (HAD superfamily)